jgi:hypothetical protein
VRDIDPVLNFYVEQGKEGVAVQKWNPLAQDWKITKPNKAK